MYHKPFHFILLLVFSYTTVLCQQQATSGSFKDSVEKRYLHQGAYRYSYFSNEWQSNIDSALINTPDNAHLWQQKAMPYFKCRKYEVGLKYLDKAVSLDPKEYLGYRAFINCVFSKNYHAAITDFLKATKLNVI